MSRGHEEANPIVAVLLNRHGMKGVVALESVAVVAAGVANIFTGIWVLVFLNAVCLAAMYIDSRDFMVET